jgi:hypothetical protein
MNLSAARQRASEALQKQRSASTSAQYERRGKSALRQLSEAGRPLTAAGLAEHAAAQGWSRRTYEQTRTALAYHLANSVREWGREADRARKRGDREAAREARRRAEAAGDGIEAARASAGDALEGRRTRSPARGLAAAHAHARARGWADWRSEIAASMHRRDDRALVAVLAATGARPAS